MMRDIVSPYFHTETKVRDVTSSSKTALNIQSPTSSSPRLPFQPALTSTQNGQGRNAPCRQS